MNRSTARRNKITTVSSIFLLLALAPPLLAETDFVVTPGRAAFPVMITLGPDGNLWFTENTGLRIGRITTAGVITEFPISGAQALTGIASGPDGNIWFTDEFAGFIGHISTSGAGLAKFALPANSHPQGIAAGPDGNLWFVDQFQSASPKIGFKIGKITTGGAITEYNELYGASLTVPEKRILPLPDNSDDLGEGTAITPVEIAAGDGVGSLQMPAKTFLRSSDTKMLPTRMTLVDPSMTRITSVIPDKSPLHKQSDRAGLCDKGCYRQ